MRRLRGLYLLETSAYAMVYGADERAAIERHVEFAHPPQTRESVADRPEVLADVEVIFGGWGMPVFDQAFLARAPRLRAVFYAAGAIGSFATDAVWDRSVAVTTANAANAIPVAEYALAGILFSLKHGWSLMRATRQTRSFPTRDGAPGCYGRTVGLVSFGAVAQALVRLLRPIDLRVLAYDPFLDADDARAQGVELVGLGEIFRRSDVVSLHTPLLPETVGLVTGEHIESMRPGATLINTARGAACRSRFLEVAGVQVR